MHLNSTCEIVLDREFNIIQANDRHGTVLDHLNLVMKNETVCLQVCFALSRKTI
jgi:hypothetical protein